MPAIIVLIFLIRLGKESVGKEVLQFSSDLREIVPVRVIIFIAPIFLIIHRRHLRRVHHNYLQHLHHHHQPRHLHQLNFRFRDQLGLGEPSTM